MSLYAPGPRLSVAGRLFQARMWREYAMTWDGRCTANRIDRAWVECSLMVSRNDCLRRARINVYLARRLNRVAKKAAGRRLGGRTREEIPKVLGTLA